MSHMLLTALGQLGIHYFFHQKMSLCVPCCRMRSLFSRGGGRATFSSPHLPCCANLLECAGLPELAPSGMALASPELCQLRGGTAGLPSLGEASWEKSGCQLGCSGQEQEPTGPCASFQPVDLSLSRPGDPAVGLAFSLSPRALLLPARWCCSLSPTSCPAWASPCHSVSSCPHQQPPPRGSQSPRLRPGSARLAGPPQVCRDSGDPQAAAPVGSGDP